MFPHDVADSHWGKALTFTSDKASSLAINKCENGKWTLAFPTNIQIVIVLLHNYLSLISGYIFFFESKLVAI